MATETATMPVETTRTLRRVNDVAKQKRSGRPPNPDGPSKAIGFRPKKRVREALAAYKADQEIRPQDGQVLSKALNEYLLKRGYLKPEDIEQ